MKLYSEEAKEKMIGILKAHNIDLYVDGCGCCGSPTVEFKYLGETVYCADDACFDTENYKIEDLK